MNQDIRLPKQCLFCRQIIPDDQSPGYVGVRDLGSLGEHEYYICQKCKAESDAAEEARPMSEVVMEELTVAKMMEVADEYLRETSESRAASMISFFHSIIAHHADDLSLVKKAKRGIKEWSTPWARAGMSRSTWYQRQHDHRWYCAFCSHLNEPQGMLCLTCNIPRAASEQQRRGNIANAGHA
jgi:hypothetical protein